MNRLLHPVMLLGFFVCISQTLHANDPTTPTTSTETKKLTTKDRLIAKIGVIDLHYDQLVQHYIESYTVRARPRAKRILARTKLYFPIIEKYLQEHNLPDELKYMIVMESAVNPNAVSDAGAVGLWQLMPRTARKFGLTVNSEIDERRDIHKSTVAALQYLKHLKKKLGSWTLAIAGYNCGGGKVLKAMRYSYSDNFWELRMFLPKQTQYYLHRMSAAIYVSNYYELHGLIPATNGYFMQFTKRAKLYNEVTFEQISKALDVPLDVLKRLNPGYRNAVIPKNQKGNYLVLPKVKMDSFIFYYNLMIADKPTERIRA